MPSPKKASSRVEFRAVATADVHISNTLPFARRVEGVRTDRLLDTLSVPRRLVEFAHENGVSYVFILGDLLDKRMIDAVTLTDAVGCLVTLADEYPDITTVIVPGNHESGDAAGSVFNVSVFRGLRPNIIVWDGPEGHAEEVGPVVFASCAYKPEAASREIIAKLRDGLGTDIYRSTLLLHHTLLGGKVGDWASDQGLKPDDLEGFKSVLLGHFHTPQAVGIARYLGAPIQHHFGDVGDERGFWLYGWDGSGRLIQSDKYLLDLPSFAILDWTGDTEITPEALDLVRNNYIQVRHVGTTTQLKTDAPGVAELCLALMAGGARLAKPLPELLSDKKERLAEAKAKTGGRLTWPSAVGSYVDACDTTGLNVKRLQAMAEAFLLEAES